MIDKLHFFNRDDNTRLQSREYTNGTNQIQAINDVIKHFENGEHIVILNGGAGSGKSIVGLETINHFGDGYVVVPRIYHQDQYREDYSKENSRVYMTDKNGDIINIQTMKGKGNFKCRLVETEEWEKYRKEHPDKLNCDNSIFPCNLSGSSQNKLKSCPHYMSNTELRVEEHEDMFRPLDRYKSVDGVRKLEYDASESLCRYHQDFKNAIDNDIVIINAKKLEVECGIGRLPKKKVLIIDEFDLFLEEISQPKVINFYKVLKSLNRISSDDKFSDKEFEAIKNVRDIIEDEINRVITKQYGKEKVNNQYKDVVWNFENLIFEKSVINIKRLFDIFMENPFLQDVKGLDSMFKTLVYNNIAPKDLNFFYYMGKGLELNIFGLNTEFMVMSIFNRFDHVLLMSATKQSDLILDRFFGISDYKMVKTEETIVGRMRTASFGLEISFGQGKYSRENYFEMMKKERIDQLKATGQIIQNTKKMIVDNSPIRLKRLFHILAFGKLPNNNELHYEGLRELGTYDDSEDEKAHFEDFKNKDVYLHKSTKMLRAIDLPDDKCRVIIFQKLPFPPQTPYHKAIQKKYGTDFMWRLLRDKCNRELIQGSTRGIRHKDDWCFIASPDNRVIEYLNYIFGNNPRFHMHRFDGVIK